MAIVSVPVLSGLLLQYLRLPTTVITGASGQTTTIPTMAVDAQGNVETTSLTFNPPLTPAEQATFDDLVTMAKFGVSMTLAEWQSIKADAAGLKSYLGVAAPTLAQTAAATKAIIRVLAVIVRS